MFAGSTQNDSEAAVSVEFEAGARVVGTDKLADIFVSWQIKRMHRLWKFETLITVLDLIELSIVVLDYFWQNLYSDDSVL